MTKVDIEFSILWKYNVYFIGCLQYSDEEYKGEAKPVWTTYQKAGTDEEDDYFEQYLERIGIKSWEGLIQDIP